MSFVKAFRKGIVWMAPASFLLVYQLHRKILWSDDGDINDIWILYWIVALLHSWKINLCLREIWQSSLTFLSNIFKGYKCKYVPPKSSKCGGVALFYRQNYKIEINKTLKVNADSDDAIDVDEIWLNTETDTGIKSTIGIIYRHPKAQCEKGAIPRSWIARNFFCNWKLRKYFPGRISLSLFQRLFLKK